MTIGGEEGLREIHGWSRYDGPGQLLKTLLVEEACKIIHQESKQGRRSALLDQAVNAVWSHHQLTRLWKVEMETDIKKTIRNVINHRRVKFTSGERQDWPENVPRPEQKSHNRRTSTPVSESAMTTDSSLSSLTSSNGQPALSDMVLSVFRYNGQVSGEAFEIRVASLVDNIQHPATLPVQHVGMLRLDRLIAYLQRNDEEGMSFNTSTEVIIRLPQQGLPLACIKDQIGFEATLQKQYNLNEHDFKLAICSKDLWNSVSSSAAGQSTPLVYENKRKCPDEFGLLPGVIALKTDQSLQPSKTGTAVPGYRIVNPGELQGELLYFSKTDLKRLS